MNDNVDRTLSVIEKNAREALHVQLRQFKGAQFFDLRLHALNGEGKMIPTKGGVTIQPRLLKPVIEALQAALNVARAEGLING